MRGLVCLPFILVALALPAHARIPEADRANVTTVPAAPDAGTAAPKAPPADAGTAIQRIPPGPEAGSSAPAPAPQPPAAAAPQPAPKEGPPPPAAEPAPPPARPGVIIVPLPKDAPERNQPAEVPEDPPPPPDQEGTAEGEDSKVVIIVPKPPEEPRADLLDGHVREGPLLSGPGSLTFMLQHTATMAVGGFLITGQAFGWGQRDGAREAMLTGSLLGAGLGFASSAWWQHHHWMGSNTAFFSISNALIVGMFATGLTDAFTPNSLALTTAALIGTELGSWGTAIFAGGDMKLDDGVFVSAGAAWGLAYAGLLLAMIGTSGTELSTRGVIDALLIAPGIGAGILGLAGTRYKPTTPQILRASAVGAGVGAAVLLVSGIVLGNFLSPIPYLLSLVSSAGGMAAVALIWPEVPTGPNWGHPGRVQDRPYAINWW